MLRTISRIGISLMVLGFVLAVLEFSLAWILSCLGFGFMLLVLSSLAKTEQQNSDYLLAIAEHSQESDQHEIPNLTATRGLLTAIVAISLFAICAGLSIYFNHPLPVLIGFVCACVAGFYYNRTVFEYRCRIWSSFADQHDLLFTSPGILNWKRENLRITGDLAGRNLRMQIVSQRTHNSHTERLMVNVETDVPMERHFCIDDCEWRKLDEKTLEALNSIPRLFFKVKAVAPVRLSLSERELSLTLPRIPQTHAELEFVGHLTCQLAEQLEENLRPDVTN